MPADLRALAFKELEKQRRGSLKEITRIEKMFRANAAKESDAAKKKALLSQADRIKETIDSGNQKFDEWAEEIKARLST